MIVDTDILIWYFRGDEPARRFLARMPFPERTVSALTVMELVQGCRDQREARDVAAFVSENLAAVIPPTRPSHGALFDSSSSMLCA